MTHTERVANYNGDSFEQLAKDIGNLRYEKLKVFLEKFSKEFERQSNNDERLGHPKLAKKLDELSKVIRGTTGLVEEIWEICEPYMQDKEDLSKNIEVDPSLIK